MTNPRSIVRGNVLALAAVSFLTDTSTEIIAPLLPIFLVGTLGATATFVGVIEGTAEAVSSLLKLASGWFADRSARRKPLVVFGYAIASAVRPLVAIAQTAGQVLAIRVIDRIGKGVRGAPRDALLAESVPVELRGRAFGFHRAADHAGAVAGPLIALLCLQLLGLEIRTVFWIAAIPGALAVIAAVLFVRETAAREAVSETVSLAVEQDVRVAVLEASRTPPAKGAVAVHDRDASRATFIQVLVAVGIFTLGNSTDAFLLLRANQLGIATALLPLVWIVLHVVKSASSTPGGALSDRFGRRPLIVSGWLLYGFVYAGFAFATEAWHAWVLFALYGVVFGLSEAPEKALVADLVRAAKRGTAFGWYHAVIGTAALPASLLFGWLWDSQGVETAFLVGGSLALVAAVVLGSGRAPRIYAENPRLP